MLHLLLIPRRLNDFIAKREPDQYVLIDGSSHPGDVIFNDGLKKVKDARVGNHQRKVSET